MAIEEDPPPGIPEWIVTYGDMMSLLLTFFIMLVSMSEIQQEKKIKAVTQALQKQFGRFTAQSILPGRMPASSSRKDRNAHSGRARRLDTKTGGVDAQSPEGEHNQVRSLPRGEHVVVGGIVYFPADGVDLDEAQKQDLRTIAQELGGKPQKIELRGHTTAGPIPPGLPFRDHWDMAYTRCRRTMEYLVELGIDPRRIRMTAAGPFEPSHILDNPQLQRANSRVEVFLLDELTEEYEGTPEERSERISEVKVE